MKRFCALTIVCSLVLALLPGYAVARAAASPAAAAEAQQTVSLDPPSSMPSLTPDQLSKLYQEYTIKHGDTLRSIGRQFGISWRYIAALNGISGPEYTIVTGHTLKIPLMPKLPGTTGNYLILCETEAQKQYIDEFEAYKTWSGFTVTVKSVEADVKPAANADRCKAIQKYLKNMDREMSLEYVLLIGSPYDDELRCPQHTGGVIPMQYLYYNPSNHNTKYDCDWYDYKNPENSGFNTPTDICYAFDFNWDYDKDGFPGETNEMAESVKQAKPEPLFLLGRIPFSDTRGIRTVLKTTMQYELGKKEHSDALINSYGGWAYYGDALAKNLAKENIEATAIFENDGDEPCKYESTYPLSAEDLNNEISKKYDFVYILENILENKTYVHSGINGLAGICFIDGFATMIIETDGRDMLCAQDELVDGSVSAVIATTREIGYNPKDPAPMMPSLLFTNKTLCVSREFYAAIQSMIMENNVPPAYVYCYLGDPSIALKP